MLRFTLGPPWDNDGVGSLASDTAVTVVDRGEDRAVLTASLSADWEIWGPNGGYLAAVAMRAAGEICGRARPASINAHFVGHGQTGPIDIDVDINRTTRVATSSTVRISQDGRPWLHAIVWGVDDALAGLEHHTAHTPADVPEPHELPTFDERITDRTDLKRHPFWRNVEQRPVTWIDDWANRTVFEPEKTVWYRFVPDDVFSDPWIDAMRPLILIDLDSWPAAVIAHVDELEHYAPSIELTARFVANARDDPWLLSNAIAPRANGGLIAATGHIWSRDLQLLATGGSTLLCRPAGRRPDR